MDWTVMGWVQFGVAYVVGVVAGMATAAALEPQIDWVLDNTLGRVLDRWL